jgi:hypothetical protein
VEVLTIVFWAVFFMVLFFVNPYKSASSLFVLFFVSIFFAVAGTWGLFEFYIVTKIKGVEEIKSRSFSAFRHGAMVSLVLTGILFMQGAGVLTPWDGVVFMLAIILFEAYFLTRDSMITDNKE